MTTGDITYLQPVKPFRAAGPSELDSRDENDHAVKLSGQKDISQGLVDEALDPQRWQLS